MNSSVIAKSKLPIDFINEINSDFSSRNADKILNGMCENRYTTFRINYLKSNEAEVENELNKNNIEFEKLKICAKFPNMNTNEQNYTDNSKDNLKDEEEIVAYIIFEKNENDLNKLKIFEEGKIYLQSISSMIPPIVLSPKSGDKVLDLASAPRK